MRRTGIPLALVGSLCIHMPAVGQPENALSAPVIGNARVLTPEQIRTAFAGHKALGHDEDGKPIDADLSEDGGAKIDYGGTTYTGTWYVDPEGKLCGRVEEFFITDTMCFTVLDDNGRSPNQGQYSLVRDKQTIDVRIVRAAARTRS